jgi:CRISPR/Cas system-associated exonuclease Cas4 (RecB family)
MGEAVRDILKGKKGKFVPGCSDPYEISRSKIQLFFNCPRCFWLDRRHGIAPPSSPPYTLNSAVDELLKREFDGYRAAHQVPSLLKNRGLLLYPAQHTELDRWRTNLIGVRVFHQATNLIAFGSIDDLWIDDLGTFYVADYKATSKNGEIGRDAEWQIGYKRQVEFYQWLLRQKGLSVSDQAWFVYANGTKDRPVFEGTLHFTTSLIPYKGNSDWVEPTLNEIVHVLNQLHPPPANVSCKMCAFVTRATEHQ